MLWKLTDTQGNERTVEPRGMIATDDISFMKKAVLAAGGIALLPMYLCAREEQSGKLVRILPGWRLTGADIHVVYPSARYVPQRVVAFRDFLVKELGTITKRCLETDSLKLGEPLSDS